MVSIEGLYRYYLKRWVSSALLPALRKGRMFAAPRTRGDVCYIVGSGPSLELDDLNAIDDNFSISSHRIYKIYQDTTWRPDLFLVNDQALLDKYGDDLAQMVDPQDSQFVTEATFPLPKGMDTGNCQFYRLLRDRITVPALEGRRSPVFLDGRSVTIVALQIAIEMGFREIRLLGIDNNYSGPQAYFSEGITNEGINQPATDIVAENLSVIFEYCRMKNILVRNFSKKSPLKIV